MYERHGLINTPEYRVWGGMRARCLNPNHPGYSNYGGRGVKICSRWDNFLFFKEDIGPRPDGSSLDRIDNDGDYCPSNCRWSTRREQNNNTRANVYLTIDGKRKTIAEWARHSASAVCYDTLLSRVRTGWDHKEAVFLTNHKDRKAK